MRARDLVLLVGLAGTSLQIGCASDTTIVVIIDTELRVPQEVDALGVEITSILGGEDDPLLSRTWQLDPSKSDSVEPPVEATLTQEDGDNQAVRVTACGYQQQALTLMRSASLAFEPGQQLVLQLDLVRSCLYRVCPEGQTCGENGCEPIEKDPSPSPP
jgi:hypothetical protein